MSAALLPPAALLFLAGCGAAPSRPATKPAPQASKRQPKPAPARRTPDLYINTPFEPGRLFSWPSFPATVFLNDNTWVAGLHWTINRSGQAVATGTNFSDLCPQGGANCPTPQGTETLRASNPETCTVTTAGGSAKAYLYNLVDSLSGESGRGTPIQGPACLAAPPAQSAGGSSSTGSGSTAWPPLVSQAMAYIEPRTAAVAEAPSQLPASSLMANSADAAAIDSSYAVSLYHCPSPLPLNDPGVGNGSCGDLADVYGAFSGKTFPDPAVAAAAQASTLNSASPECPGASQSKVQLSPGGPSATLYEVDGQGCMATWTHGGWTFILAGDLYSGSGTIWKAVASQIANYTTTNPLPGDDGLLSCDIAPDGVHTSLYWTTGPSLYGASAYHGSIPAIELAESMLPYRE